MNTIIVDNFFDNFENIKNEFKKIPLLSCEEYFKKFNKNESWPGFRSGTLDSESPFLFNLLIKELFSKFGHEAFYNNKIIVKSHLHLRLDDDNSKDWIHTDEDYFASFIVYLSDTNLNSGTCLYDNNKNLTTTINFVQNRAILFDSKTNHKSLANYGNNIQDGRLTLNCFITLSH